MPVLIYIGCVNFVVSSLTDKYVLLRASCMPPMISADTARVACEIGLVAGVAHCAVGIWMLGQQEVFPSSTLGGLPVDVSDGLFTKLSTRMFTTATVPLTLVLCVMLIWYLFRIVVFVVGSTIGVQLRMLTTACCPTKRFAIVKDEEAAEGSVDPDGTLLFAEHRRMMERRGLLVSYLPENNRAYKQIIAAIRDLADRKRGATPEKTAPDTSVEHAALTDAEVATPE